MADLQSKGWIVFKGVAFLGIAVTAGVLVFLDAPSLKTAVLLVLLAWSAAHFYYFLFYVLEKYVDPSLRYAGILALLRAILARRSA